jgi:cytochrome oxidase assembly protein ShyY1
MAFRADWKMSLFVLIMLPSVIALGVWQLQRANYKQGLQDTYFDQQGGLAMPLADLSQRVGFSRVRVTGRYLGEQYLLDNKVREGRQGYWLFSPFVTHVGAKIMVNRGWLPAPRLRTDELYLLATPAGEVSISGLLWPDTGTTPLFGHPAIEAIRPLLYRMQRLDWPELQARQPELQATELRLEPGEAGVLAAAPQVFDFGVARHVGYAIQWFGLAVALSIGFVVYGRRRP